MNEKLSHKQLENALPTIVQDCDFVVECIGRMLSGTLPFSLDAIESEVSRLVAVAQFAARKVQEIEHENRNARDTTTHLRLVEKD